jgi:peptidoglycan L-alanyl-D-glutamate endopeptidase CwlK
MGLMTDDAFVRYVQEQLARKGAYTGPIDGLAGSGTQAALLGALGLSPEPSPLGASILDARSEERLKGVHPDLVKVVKLAALTVPVKFTVLEGLRSVTRQRQLVASGASQTMRSRHLTGHAVDIAPLGANGQVSWDWPLYYRLEPAMKQAATELGVPIEWGGDWASFKDGPHWQLPWGAYP